VLNSRVSTALYVFVLPRS